MRPPTLPPPWVLLLALLAPTACSKHKDPAGTGAPGSPLATASAVARDTIAPVILQLWPSPPATTEVEDPHYKDAAAAVALDEAFLLEVGMGSGLDGLNVTTVPASGHASHVYQVREKGATLWRRVTFDVDKAELGRLVHVLEENHFLKLAQRYDATGVADGTQWIVHLRSGGLDKYVSASNAFPEPLVAVARFVSEQLVDTRRELREKSKPAPLGSQYGAHLWRGARIYRGTLEPGALGFEDAARVSGLLVPDLPLAEGTQIEVTIVDSSEADEVLTQTVQSSPRFWAFYNAAKVDPWHHYTMKVKLLAGSKVLAASEALPVITFDGAQALEVPLPRP